MKRPRGRGRRQPNSLNRSYDSNGPDVRVRGTATQVYEKYQVLARDAQLSGDRVGSENYMQHAEHYYRILLASQPARPVESATDANDDGLSDDDEIEANGVSMEADDGEAEKANGEDAGSYEPLILSREKPAKSKAESSEGRKAKDSSGDEAGGDEKQERGSRRRGPLRRRRSADKTAPESASDEGSSAEAAAEAAVDAAVEAANIVEVVGE